MHRSAAFRGWGRGVRPPPLGSASDAHTHMHDLTHSGVEPDVVNDP